jgi:hypothetical protein
MMPRFEKMVRDFLKGTELRPSSQWIEPEFVRDGELEVPIKVYLRKMQRMYPAPTPELPHNMIRLFTIDVSNVLVEPFYQRQGLFSEFLKLVEDCANGRAIYIENVLDELQHGIYLRRGYSRMPTDFGNELACFYKLPLEA